MKYKHGTHKAYVLGECRCERCVQANEVAQSLINEPHAKALAEGHGRTDHYITHKCRHPLCRAAIAAYMQDYRKRKREGYFDKPRTLTCEWCHEQFTHKPTKRENPKYCCTSHQQKAYWQNHKRKNDE